MNKNNDNFNRLAIKAGFFYVLTQLLVRGITFLTTPIYTRLVDTAQYGQLRVYESWLLIFVPLMSLGLYRGVERAKYDYPDKYDEYVSASQTLSYISISIFGVVFVCFYKPISRFLGMNPLLFFIMFLYIFAYTSTLYFQRREKQKLQYKMVTRVTIATMLPATVFSIMFLAVGNRLGYSEYLVEFRVVGYYLPQILVGFFLTYLIIKQGRCLYDKTYWKYGLMYSIPLIPEQLSIQIMNQSDKIMIQKMIGADSAGIFSLATTVSYIMWIIEESVWNAWLPWLYEKISRQEEKDIERPWIQIAIIFCLMSLVIVFITPEIVLILGGEGYEEACYLIAPMTVGTLFRFFSYIYSSMQNYYMKTKFVAFGTILSMFLNVVLNYIGIINWGYQAAAYTTAFSYFMLMVVQGILEKKIAGKCIIPIWKMVLISLGVFGASIGIMQIFSWDSLLRWSIASLIGGIGAIRLLFVIKKELSISQK